MQRENKYRGKRTDTKEWVYGNLLKLETDYFTDSNDTGFTWYIIPHITNGSLNKNNLMLKFISPCFEVMPETVGEYTGLPDKKGNEIFEGDIVDNSYINPLSDSEVIQRYVVRWENGIYRMIFIDSVPKKYYDRMLFLEFNQVEVNGNICDNPELLQEAAEK